MVVDADNLFTVCRMEIKHEQVSAVGKGRHLSRPSPHQRQVHEQALPLGRLKIEVTIKKCSPFIPPSSSYVSQNQRNGLLRVFVAGTIYSIPKIK
jgi:hypothetical protein